MNRLSLYVPVFTATLIISASLLFSVQPMFAKMILPLLGGTPQVWNTSMLFFQGALLAGYAYAHFIGRFAPFRAQAVLHVILLGLFAFALPFGIPESWREPHAQSPALWQLGVMTLCIGGPFFILASSAPLFQKWFSLSPHPDASNPYFLYAASNLGSVGALLAYPFLIEPVFSLTDQSLLWTYGYSSLFFLTVVCALLIWRSRSEEKTTDSTVHTKPHLSWTIRGLWVLLAFVPSSLMLGVTTYITTDIASAPLLWIVPLTLYIGTFIIAFARKAPITLTKTRLFHALLLLAVLGLSIKTPAALSQIFVFGLVLHLAAFGLSALLCHMELAQLRPDKTHLTEFYLLISLGGVLGGFFNAIIAPLLFVIPLEYGLALGLSCFMRYAAAPSNRRPIRSIEWAAFGIAALAGLATALLHQPLVLYALAGTCIAAMALLLDRRWLFAGAALAILLLNPPSAHNTPPQGTLLHAERNFFGVLRVFETPTVRLIMHGSTIHGSQAIAEEHKLTPIGYYSRYSSVNDVFESLGSTQQRVAILGLGSGVTACYQKDQRHFDFYEIDPAVIAIAEDPRYFTYLSDCGSPYTIIQGDARLKLEDAQDQSYDLVFADAFSSDNIPVHLITAEAIELYKQKMKPDGIILFNISNRYIDLTPVLAEAAAIIDLTALVKFSPDGKIPGTEIQYYPTDYIAMVQSETLQDRLIAQGWQPVSRTPGFRLWTDQYSNVVQVIGNTSSLERQKLYYRNKKSQSEEKGAE